MSFILSEELPRFYGRRKGRKLSKSGILAFKKGSKYILDCDKSLEVFFDTKQKLVLEIGFGNGENLINSAKKNPNTLFIGADPFLNTNVKCIKKILENNLKNIKIWPDDIRKILKFFPLKSVSEIKLLFPDPWPKLKHKDRRLIQTKFIDTIYPILKTKGTITVGTDHKILKSWILEKFQICSKFEWLAERANDWRIRPKDCFTTKYEQKSLKENRKSSWFIFEKK